MGHVRRVVSEEILPELLAFLKALVIEERTRRENDPGSYSEGSRDMESAAASGQPIYVQPNSSLKDLNSGLGVWRTVEALLLHDGEIASGFQVEPGAPPCDLRTKGGQKNKHDKR